jgi:hypothetical protein
VVAIGHHPITYAREVVIPRLEAQAAALAADRSGAPARAAIAG